ncbi:MAG: outer membrane protein assembly factor BamD [Alphaproteobacteria bacterium]|nr:outer membrane protein assembly factor BamD [Alphaproteobacteria bacterium]
MTRFLTCLLFALSLPVLVAGCASDKKEPVEKPVDQLYSEARRAFNEKDYKEAANKFDEVERQHPYSEWATQAKINSAYASYQADDYDMAVATLDNFIELHPGHPDIAYAYYLRAICYYEQIVDVGRDQEQTRKATDALGEVIRRFPDTAYARDAKFKKDLTLDHLAGKEMEIGRFYLKRKYYQAAINRFKTVIDQYQTTTHTPEALHRLVEAYLALGLPDEAKKMGAILGYNYPGSEWYQASYSLLTQGKTMQLDKPKPAKTTAGKLKNKITGLFE